MNIDTLWFFQIFLGGFVTVWIYRSFSGKKEPMAEFEWISSSAFWGLICIVVADLVLKKISSEQLFNNPLTTGAISSAFGIFLGYAGSRLVFMKWFQNLFRFLGKGSRDGSERVY